MQDESTAHLEPAEFEASALYNADLAPVPPARRTWRVGSFAALWISMSACIPTYMLASSLIGGGMNWSQAILTIFFGNLIVVIPMILNAHAGTRYGISVPGFLSRVVWDQRGQRPRINARLRRLRMVWHSNVDRRRRDLQNPGCFLSRFGRAGRADIPRYHAGGVPLFPLLLGDQHAGRLHGDRIHSHPAEYQSAAPDRARPRAPRVGFSERWRVRPDPRPAIRVRSRPAERRPVLGVLRSRSHGDDRLLGHAFAQYPGLLALRAFAARPDPGTSDRVAVHDGALFIHRRRRHVGYHDHLRQDDLGSGGRVDPFPKSDRARNRNVRALPGHARDQHRGQCR